MDSKLIVELKLQDKTFKDKVSTKNCTDIADFKHAIKLKFSPLLDAYAAAQLSVFEAYLSTKVDPEKEMRKISVVKGRPLVVTVEEAPRNESSSSSDRYYQHLKAVCSSRAYLNSIAQEMEKQYELQKLDMENPATIGDILWNRRQRVQARVKPPNTKPLSEYFTGQQRRVLEILDNVVNPKSHTSLGFKADNQTKEVVLPINVYHLKPEYQRIAAEANLVAKETDLIVKCDVSCWRSTV
jgi:hypothetical protein